MKITNFGTEGMPQPLSAWSTGVVATASNSLFSSTASNTLAVNGVTVTGAAASNYHILASSPTAAAWVPDAGGGGTVSAGSNSTRVREVPTAGASTTLWSPYDHAHDGIGTITASSSNTMQRGTWNLRPGVGIALSLTDTDGDGEFDTATIVNTGVPGPAGGGGGGASVPTMVQWKTSGTGNTALTLTMDAAPTSGNIILLSVYLNGGTNLTSVTQTNVTWTRIHSAATASVDGVNIWVGKVGASAATLITIVRPGANAVWTVIELAETLTPTLGLSAGGTGDPEPLGIAATTAGHLIAMMSGGRSQNQANVVSTSIPTVGIHVCMCTIVAGYSNGGQTVIGVVSTDASGYARLIAEIT